MTAVPFSDAAAALGFKSRSSLYRLRDASRLDAYLRPGGKGGAELLEMDPPGLPSLREHVAGCLRSQINNFKRKQAQRPRTDPRWAAVAETLSDAAGVTLAAVEAEAIAQTLPDAIGAVWGFPGLEALREELAAAGHPDVGPTAAPDPAGSESFWREYGDWRPAEPLEEAELWEHVGGIAAAMVGEPPMAGPEAWELFRQLGEALADVRAGARWDPQQWAEQSVRTLLADAAEGCPASLAELAAAIEGGRLPAELPADLQAEARQAIATGRSKPQAPPLPAPQG